MITGRRLSLYARMLVATGVLASFTVVLTVFFALLAVFGAAIVGSMALPVYGVVTQLPRLAALVGVPPLVAALVGAAYLVLGHRYGTVIEGWSDSEYVFWPADPVTYVTTALALVAVYEIVVESIVAVGRLVAANVQPVLAVGTVGTVLCGVYISGRAVAHEMRRLRERSLRAADTSDSDDLSRRVTRLAAMLDVPPPEIVVRRTDRTYAYTVGTAGNRVIVVSAGVVEALDEGELDAVIAHELGHVANRDVTLMSAALAPVLVAEEVHRDDLGRVDAADDADRQDRSLLQRLDDAEDRMAKALGDAVTGAILRYGQFGAGVLSRGREYAADRAAAELTGDPGALASALRTLHDARRRPQRDLRDADVAVQALNIAPARSDDRLSFATHPPTEDRLERLRELERAQERA